MMLEKSLPTKPSPSTMNPPHMPLFLTEPLLTPRLPPADDAIAAAFTVFPDADGGGVVNVMGFEFDHKNPFFFHYALVEGGRRRPEERGHWGDKPWWTPGRCVGGSSRPILG